MKERNEYAAGGVVGRGGKILLVQVRNLEGKIVWTFPKIRAVQVERVVEGDIFLIARFLFDNAADARAALDSPERAHARADRANFPPFAGTVRHQIVDIIEVPR